MNTKFYHLYQREIHGMHSHHRMANEYFAKHDDMILDNALNTNQCNPNLNYHTIVEMLFPLGLVHGTLTITRKKNNFKLRLFSFEYF